MGSFPICPRNHAINMVEDELRFSLLHPRQGACLNYELSALLVRDMIIDLMPGKIGAFQRSIQRHQDSGHLLNFFVVLRVRHMPFRRFIFLAGNSGSMWAISLVASPCHGSSAMRRSSTNSAAVNASCFFCLGLDTGSDHRADIWHR